MNVLNALWPILLALPAGVVFGRLAPAALNHRLIGLIAPLIWLMLFLIGHEFGEILLSARAVGQILRNAVIITLCVTLIPSVLIFLSMRLLRQRQERLSVMNPKHPGHASRNTSSSAFDPPAGDPASVPQPAGNTARQSFGQRLRQAWPPLREALIALGMVAGGALLFLLESWPDFHLPLPSSGTFLLLLIGMVGIDLAQIRLSRQWLSISMLAVPALVVVGSLLGGVLAASLTETGLSPKAGYLVLASLNVVPQMRRRMGIIKEAQEARGVETKGNVFSRIKAYVPLLGPVVMSSLTDAQERGMTLETRGFGIVGVKPTSLFELEKTRSDKVLKIVLICFFVITILVSLAMRFFL